MSGGRREIARLRGGGTRDTTRTPAARDGHAPGSGRWRSPFSCSRPFTRVVEYEEPVIAPGLDYQESPTDAGTSSRTSFALQTTANVVLTRDHAGQRPLSHAERRTDTDDERFFAIVTDLIGTPTELVDTTPYRPAAQTTCCSRRNATAAGPGPRTGMTNT
ncbi:hypothetical protein ACFCYI_23815 [Streptomyces sp. NPDC056257]|uniref:hypothetical protein n=1 Tax=Streptomyces sp. NPDC056257 TaxID=3345765 RepID=UPI0035DB47BD